VTLVAQGNLYGTIVDGGANNMGTVFELIERASIVPEPRSIVALGQAAALLGIGLAVRTGWRRAQAR
jgi:hypothetical protein